MNTKNNKRRKASVEKIKSSFLELLKKKDITKITVSDVCEGANINRSTFYANFIDIYDLADKILVELHDEVGGFFGTCAADSNISVRFEELFKHIKNHQALYLFYFKLGYEHRKWDFRAFFDINEMEYGENLEYHIEFFKTGFNGMVKMWLENGCKETPQQMRDVLLYEYRGRFLENK